MWGVVWGIELTIEVMYTYKRCGGVHGRTSSGAVVSGARGPARALVGEAALPSSADEACALC